MVMLKPPSLTLRPPVRILATLAGAAPRAGKKGAAPSLAVARMVPPLKLSVVLARVAPVMTKEPALRVPPLRKRLTDPPSLLLLKLMSEVPAEMVPLAERVMLLVSESEEPPSPPKFIPTPWTSALSLTMRLTVEVFPPRPMEMA